jgi:hypothetical protein
VSIRTGQSCCGTAVRGASALLQVHEHQRVLPAVHSAGPEGEDLGHALTGLPAALQQQAIARGRGGVDDHPRLLARDGAGQLGVGGVPERGDEGRRGSAGEGRCLGPWNAPAACHVTRGGTCCGAILWRRGGGRQLRTGPGASALPTRRPQVGAVASCGGAGIQFCRQSLHGQQGSGRGRRPTAATRAEGYWA